LLDLDCLEQDLEENCRVKVRLKFSRDLSKRNAVALPNQFQVTG
jgi:hypothetical protein